MKRIYVMDGDGIQEYIPIDNKNQSFLNHSSEQSPEIESCDSLLTISNLLKKFPISRPTIYSWEKKGLLKRIPIGGRVFFDPNDISALISKNKKD